MDDLTKDIVFNYMVYLFKTKVTMSLMKRKNSSSDRSTRLSFKELILGVVVVVSLLGLIGFSIIDVNSRAAFLDIAKISIGAYMGYLIPNHTNVG